MYFEREEEKIALGGTAGSVLLLILFLILMIKFCPVEKIDELDAGGVMVSLGEPDQGGEDESTAQQEEEYTPPVEEEYESEHQVTSDEPEAPAVQETKPTPKPTTKPKPPETKPTTKPKPTPKPRQADPRSKFFGSKTKGSGSGGGTTGGDKGDPDGSPDGKPDGQGSGNGSGPGQDLGPGIDGGINGFRVASLVKPRGGVQENGTIRLQVCVDKAGNVIPSRIKFVLPKNPKYVSNIALKKRAIEALKQFKFQNTSGSNGGCGYIDFSFKVH